MIECLECNKSFKIVSPAHLKHKHNMTVKEYLNKYPNCPTGYNEMCNIQKQTNLKLYGVENVSKLQIVREKIIIKNTGKKHSLTSKIKMRNCHIGKILSETHRKNISLKSRRSIEKLFKKYPLFSKIEEMRYNPEKPIEEREIQVHCKNHNCINSKEKGGWFTPNKNQLMDRIRALEKENGNEGNFFYCSNDCRDICPLYNKRVDYILKEDPIVKIFYTDEEHKTFRQEVLNRDDYKCQYCENEAEHVHHIKPQKLEPFFSLDPDYAISVCKDCHYKYGHQDECSTGNISKISCDKIIRTNK